MENNDDCVPDTGPFRGVLAKCFCSVVPRCFVIAHAIHNCHECDLFREQYQYSRGGKKIMKIGTVNDSMWREQGSYGR